MEELHCLNCNQELPEDNFGRRDALVLTDEREQIPVVMASWCGETCMAQWLVKSVVDAMAKQMMKPPATDELKRRFPHYFRD